PIHRETLASAHGSVLWTASFSATNALLYKPFVALAHAEAAQPNEIGLPGSRPSVVEDDPDLALGPEAHQRVQRLRWVIGQALARRELLELQRQVLRVDLEVFVALIAPPPQPSATERHPA